LKVLSIINIFNIAYMRPLFYSISLISLMAGVHSQQILTERVI
jgi:hypothetical protein